MMHETSHLWNTRNRASEPGSRIRPGERRASARGGFARSLRVERLEDRLLMAFDPVSSPIEVGSAQGESISTEQTVAAAPDGNDQVVWQGTGGIDTQLFDSSGAPLTDEVHVGNTTTADDSQATVAMSTNGYSAVAWTDQNPTTGQTSIEAQLFQLVQSYVPKVQIVLTPIGSPAVVSTGFAGGSASQPSVALSGENIFIAYTDTNSNATLTQVKAVEVASTGVQTPIEVTSSSPTSQPSIAMSPSGNFVVAFTFDASAPSDVARGYVLAQQFSASGATDGPEFVVGSSRDVENQPNVAISSNGNFVVAYTLVVSSTEEGGVFGYVNNVTDVDAIVYNGSGTALFPTTVYANSSSNAYNPTAAIDASGNFVVGFTANGNYADDDPDAPGPLTALASAYTSAGNLVQADFDLAAGMPAIDQNGDNDLASVALSSSGSLAADWLNDCARSRGKAVSRAFSRRPW